MGSGGLGFSASAGLLGSDEHAVIRARATNATTSFFMVIPVGFYSPIASPLYWSFTVDSYLDRLRQELETTMTVASSERMDNGPVGKWTPAQVLEHLFLTYRGTNAGIA